MGLAEEESAQAVVATGRNLYWYCTCTYYLYSNVYNFSINRQLCNFLYHLFPFDCFGFFQYVHANVFLGNSAMQNNRDRIIIIFN